MKTMPAFWARSSASRTTRSMSTMRAASSCARSSTASFTFTLRLRFFGPPPSIDTMGLLPMDCIMSWSPCAMSSIPGAMKGIAAGGRSVSSISTGSSSSVPARSWALAFSRPPACAAPCSASPSPRTRDTALRKPSPNPDP